MHVYAYSLCYSFFLVSVLENVAEKSGVFYSE